ncbi:MAG: hypothetical protein SOW80_12265 [Anaerovoracaceae bacterium]|nr:hypothetical protein [Anaerovoracaceae bacterium]
MKKKKEKVCPCGRIIADPKNKTGLCPRCKRKAANGIALGGTIGGLALVKKYGPKIVKEIDNLTKQSKK